MEKRLVVAKEEVVRGGMDWDLGVSRCKLLCIGWINNTSYCLAQRTGFSIL